MKRYLDNPIYSQEQPEPLILQSLQMQQQQEGPGDQQQQQQQQQQEDDPFADMDLSLVPDDVRQAIERSQAATKQLRTTHQTLAQQHQQTQQRVQELERGDRTPPQQRQQRDPDEPVTVEQELTDYYIAQGVDPKQAAQIAKMNSGAFNIMGKRIQGGVQQQLSPIVGRVIEDNAENAFHSVAQGDTLGMLQIPEVAQAFWDRLQGLAQQGNLIEHGMAAGLAKILWTDHITKHGLPDTLTTRNEPDTIPFPSKKPMTPAVNPQGGPQFTYPGSGHHVQVRRSQGANSGVAAYTAEERAAMAATVGDWPIKPKDFADQKRTVTRGAA